MKRILGLAFVLGACAVSREGESVSSTAAAHTEGVPLADAPAIVWADDSFEDFDRLAGDGATWLPADHPLVVRLQFWADQLYAAAAALQPSIAARVPPPKVAIQKSNIQNAWVSQIPTSWSTAARVAPAGDAGTNDDLAVNPALVNPEDAPPAPTSTPDAHLLANMHAQVARVRLDTRELVPTPQDQSDLFGYLNTKFQDCRLSADRGGIVFTNCITGPTTAPGKFAYAATSRWLTLTTGRIAFFHAEEENVATMAHELGHYFRAHPATPRDQYNYYYSLLDMTPGKPFPDPRFWAETEATRLKILQPNANFVDERLLMIRNNLGFYTTEQEADELGMEMLMRIGLPPTLIQDKQLHAMQAPGADAAQYAQCIAERSAGWKNEFGDPLIVPAGSPADEHHDNCFRVFNADREMLIHKYVVTAPKPTPPGDWDAALAAIPK